MEDNDNNTNDEAVKIAAGLQTDKHGIQILPTACSLEIELNQIKTAKLEVTNNGTERVLLKKAKFQRRRNSQLTLLSPKDTVNTYISPKETISYEFQCEGKHLGLNGEVFHFYFQDFTIPRRFEINVVSNKEMNKFLECKFDTVVKVVHTPKNNMKSAVEADVVLYGPKPWKTPKFVQKERRTVFKIPQKLWNITETNMGEARIKTLTSFAPFLKTDLSFANYADRFHTLLFLEEIYLKFNFQKFNMEGVFFDNFKDYLSLEVPGLVEKRPSLIIGDKVSVTQPWADQGKTKNIGYIYDIREKEIFVKFHASFHDSYDGSECDVVFEPNTNFFSRCHEAVNRGLKVLGKQWLFPSSVNEKPPQITFDIAPEQKAAPKKSNSDAKAEAEVPPSGKNKRNLVWANKNLNDRQKLAVVNILKGLGRPLPYIIFGPPGTGKTVTLVEVIIQIYRMIPESRILIATPSNSAADLICERLIDLGNFNPGQLVRPVALYRVCDGLIPARLIPYSTFLQTKEIRGGRVTEECRKNNIRGSSLSELAGSHRITVATCVTIGTLHYTGLKPGHFSHILIDEAGQTSEPEVLITTTFQNFPNGQVVLTGDPQQLGPVVFSHAARKFGLGVSLLQRLISTFPYCKDMNGFPKTSGYDPRFITKLNVNYRCVPEILLLPSQLFYNSDLISTVSQTDSEEADIIKKFNFKAENRDTPPAIIFHGIIGQNYQERDSPSWYNPHEIWQIVFYIRKLYSIGLDCDKVGIVSPYAKQVQKLKQLLTSLKLSTPKIGSVEEFQGQERHVIVVSTVRSSPKYVASDIAHSLGFVASPQRLNVALTRARALLIIVGNPFLLSQDPYWLNVVKYCVKNNSYTGCNLDSLNDKLEGVKDGESTKETEQKNSNVPN